ncbi:MAG: radical SAM family heme chaperone HemW [Sutterellaceae bacterium]|nr:radical SAM family heme chaperone HemW [Burkholderiaceae bacterium]MDW8430464.1 radical SAM family heme chaperone HemW [Sutterellaceae bacterium]
MPVASAGGGIEVPPLSHYLRPGVLSLSRLPPLALYLHFPWCVRKCPYCDFNSHEPLGGVHAIPEVQYLEALRCDLEAALPYVWGRPIVSVYLGGGTPSLLSPEGLARLLSDVRALLPLVPDCEITLEANPGTVEATRFAAYRAAGVNRLSLGIQSFDDIKLKALGRIHDRAQAIAAIECAQRHFDNFNLDLMFALPGQSLAELHKDLLTALDFAPPHLSVYQLTLEPNTVFAKHPPPLPDEDLAAAMWDTVQQRLGAAGYRHYEVSAYARPGKECRHNINYWTFGDYLGIGAGAHGKLSFPHRIVRQRRLRQPATYLAQRVSGRFVADSWEVRRADLPFEFMLNALRLTQGVPAALFSARTGLPPSAIAASVERAVARGLLEATPVFLRPTPLGRRFLSDLQALFLPE